MRAGHIDQRARRRAEHRARILARRSPQTFPAIIVLLHAALGIGSLVVASLALAAITPGWAVIFFYAVPALVFAGWSLREFSPSLWRRSVFPFARLWRNAAGSAPPSPQPPAVDAELEEERRQERAEEQRARRAAATRPSARLAAFEEGTIERWLLVMRPFLAAWRSRKMRRVLNAVFGVAALALTGFAALHFARVGWPLAHASVRRVCAAGALLLTTFAFKAFGWQRLFRPNERPTSISLAAAGGIAAVAGVALPGRFEDALRITVVRRFAGIHVGVGTVALSLFVLGLLDTAALAPFAAIAAIGADVGLGVQIAFGVVAGAGVGAAILAAALPRISANARLGRYRLARWLSKHAPTSRRDITAAGLLVLGAWAARTTGLVLLLSAFGLGLSFPLAAAVLAGGAASAALPISPAGAATQAGVGAAVLAAAGVSARGAIAFAVAAQLLTILAGALIALFALSLQAVGRLRRR